FRSESGVSLVGVPAFARMAVVELRSPPGIRGCFRNRLRLDRSPPKICVRDYTITLGQRRSAAHLLLGAALGPTRTRYHLFDRLRIALGPSGRTCRQQRHVARQSIPVSSSEPSWTRRLWIVAYAVLVQVERCVSSSSLRQRCSLFVAADFRRRSGAFT